MMSGPFDFMFDFDELEYMDEDERREAIEEAGYDPDDVEFEYDFDQ